MMRRLCSIVTALFTGVNGVTMLVDPVAWYSRVPGVSLTGPFNQHLVLDVGLAFVVVAGAFAAVAWRRQLWPAALTGAAFLALHGTLHLWDIALGHTEHPLFEVALGVVPAMVAVVVAWPRKEELGW